MIRHIRSCYAQIVWVLLFMCTWFVLVTLKLSMPQPLAADSPVPDTSERQKPTDSPTPPPLHESEDGAQSEGVPETPGAKPVPAKLAERDGVPRGYNIALAALGGKVESVTSQYNNTGWAAQNLIDGIPLITTQGGECSLCGWAARDTSLPQELIFSFHQGKETQVTAVVIDTTPGLSLNRSNSVTDHPPQHVEVWTSRTSPTDGFSKVIDAHLHQRGLEQVIIFPPTPARFVKLRFVSTYGGSPAWAREIKIIEAAENSSSIMAEVPRNIAHPALGGAVVRFSSQSGGRYSVHGLFDDRTNTRGWQSGNSYLPQEFIFAFRQDHVALVDKIILTPSSDLPPATWPKLISVSVSAAHPFDGFDEIGTFTLAQRSAEHAFPIDRPARFVRLRILENFGGRSTSLGKLQIIEGAASGYESVVSRIPDESLSSFRTESGPAAVEAASRTEQEPNDTPDQATPLQLGEFTQGTINPLGEVDHFQLSVPEPNTSALTLDLAGRPNIRTSLTLLDPTGRTLKRFDPGRIPQQETRFSWMIDPGEYLVQVSEPPVSLVLIWDTSGSMQGSTQDLQHALETYLDQVRPSEQLNLIRFSDSVERLLPAFTNDRDHLKTAIRGKIFANGGTPLYDAIAEGMALLEGVEGNKAIVIMTDGADSTSRTFNHLSFWQHLEDKRIRLYTIGLGGQMRDYLPSLTTSGERILTHMALATNGRFFFARTSEELQGFYEQIAAELRIQSRYSVRATLSRGLGHLSVVSTGERIVRVSAPRVELILDASGSMIDRRNKLNGRFKMDVAKEVMGQLIQDLPDEVEVALRVYGRRIREGRRGDCQDTELLFPFARINKPILLSQLKQIRALGTTPLAYSLQHVASDFGNASGEKIVILVTDGKEECGGDPSAVVTELQNRGLNIRVNVVGFALADEETKQEMTQVAGLTGGLFFEANDATGLRRAIREALTAPYDVLDAAGTKVGTGLTGQPPISVPEGVYSVVVHTTGEPLTVIDVPVGATLFTKVDLKKEGQEVGSQVAGPLPETEADWLDEGDEGPEEVSLQEDSAPAEGETREQAPELSAVPPASEQPELRADPHIQRAQELFRQVGLNPGPADGLWGRKTQEATQRFQRHYMKRSRSTGRLDDATYAALEEAATKGWRVPSKPKTPLGAYRVVRGTPVLSQPRTDARLIMRLRPGARINVVGERGRYLEIQSRRGRPPGYIAQTDVEFVGRSR